MIPPSSHFSPNGEIAFGYRCSIWKPHMSHAESPLRWRLIRLHRTQYSWDAASCVVCRVVISGYSLPIMRISDTQIPLSFRVHPKRVRVLSWVCGARGHRFSVRVVNGWRGGGGSGGRLGVLSQANPYSWRRCNTHGRVTCYKYDVPSDSGIAASTEN